MVYKEGLFFFSQRRVREDFMGEKTQRLSKVKNGCNLKKRYHQVGIITQYQLIDGRGEFNFYLKEEDA